MGIGVSVFLIAVGAILAFAVEVEVAGLELEVVGYILMAAGLIGLLLSLFLWGPRSRNSVQERRVYDDRPARGSVVEERRTYDDGDLPPR